MKAPTLAELRQKPHWSYSSINQFLNVCSLQWAYRHVYHEEPLTTPVNLVFGTVFHRSLEFASRLRQAGKPVPTAELRQLFGDLWSQACKITQPAMRFEPDFNANAFHNLGTGMLAIYLAGVDPAETVVAVSQAFSVPLVDAAGEELDRPLIGEFDCMVEVGGQRFIVDWKTAARKWPEAKVRLDLQPTCYLYAHRHGGGRETDRFRFDVITKAKNPTVEHYETVRDDDCFTRLTETVRVIEQMVRAEQFLPNDQGFACGDCPYGMACQAWHRTQTRCHYRLELAA